jgi:hypothetical protein
MPSALSYVKKMHDVSHSIADLFAKTTPELGSALFGCFSSDLAPNNGFSGSLSWINPYSGRLFLINALGTDIEQVHTAKKLFTFR